MQQISRPYQIALVVLLLAAATWLVAFGHHSSSGGGSSASSSASSSTSQPSSGSSGSSSQVYHGSAPGVEGLTKAIAKAHAAVGTSEANARHLEEKSAQATSTTPAEAASAGSGSSSASTSSSTAHGAGTLTTPATHASKPATTHVKTTTHVTTTHATATTPTKTVTRTTTTHVAPAPSAHHSAPTTAGAKTVGTPSGQQEVEAAVAKGKVALLLFWNPAGSNDRAVHGQVHSVKDGHSGVDVFESGAQDVASFGTITRQMPVYGTPTILIIGPHRTDSLTGLQDAFSIEQAIHEVLTG